MKNIPLVYIIVLNYCSAEDTIQCIEKIRNIDYTNLRLLILDNCSPDGSGDLIKKIATENEFIQMSSNFGYAEGNNKAINIALKNGTDYVFVVNPDIQLESSSLTEYIAIMESDKSIGAMNPVQLAKDGSIDKKFYNGVLARSGYAEPDYLRKDSQEVILHVESLFGASLLLSRTCIEKVGLFDPLYFAYGEEEDLCRRIKYHGFKLAVLTNPPVVHLRTHEGTSVDDQRLFLRLKGIYLYSLKDVSIPFTDAVAETWQRFVRDMRVVEGFGYKMKKRHYRKVLFWIILHLPLVLLHRKLDCSGGSYIES